MMGMREVVKGTRGLGVEKTVLFDSRNQEDNFPPRVNKRT